MLRALQSIVRSGSRASSRVESLESRTLLSAVKIMPLGDSITECDTTHSGYRFWLYNELIQSGFNVDFVGSNSGAYGGTPLYPGFDQDHEGHSGWRADTLAAGLANWAPIYKPDVALVHVGTNDVGQGQTTASTVDDINLVIDRLRAGNPSVTILLAEIIPTVTQPTQIRQLDDTIPGIVAARSTAQSRVILVDQWTGFNAATDTFDGAHPNDAGAQKMAAKWYGALYSVLRPGVAVPPPPIVTPGLTYVSDLAPTYASNFWGPWEKDQSNGEQYAHDGRTITLNGKTYAKGIGLHAASELDEALGGRYTRFQADLGVDDEVGAAGSVDFKIFADNVLIYDSGKMTGLSPTQSVDLNVAGKQVLKLVVDNAGDGANCDHADFADARLISGTGTTNPAPPPVNVTPVAQNDSATTTAGTAVTIAVLANDTDSDGTLVKSTVEIISQPTHGSAQIDTVTGNITYTPAAGYVGADAFSYRVKDNAGAYSNTASVAMSVGAVPPVTGGTAPVYLGDLAAVSSVNGYGSYEKNRSNGEQGATDGHTLTLNGKAYAKGLGVHARSEIVFNVAAGAKRFVSDLGVDDEVGSAGSVVFEVYSGATLLFSSQKLTGASAVVTADVALAGVTQLKLVVTDSGDGNAYDHGDWADARFTF